MRNVQSSSKAQRSISYGQETRHEVEEIVGMAIAMEEKSGKENQVKVVIPTGYDLSDCLNVSAKQASAEPKLFGTFLRRYLQTLLDPVVQKQVNANLGLKVNQGFCFSC